MTDDSTTPEQVDASNGRAALPLLDHHRRELLVHSAIDPDVVAERGYTTVSRPTANDQRPRQQLKHLGIPTWATAEDRFFPGLLIPQYRATGERVSAQWKPYVPVVNRDGKRMRYASARGQSSRIDVHPRWSRDRGGQDPTLVPFIRDINTPLWITEGIKKADSLTSRGCCTIALAGVFNWRAQLGTLGDWEDVPLKGRVATICFDADARNNPNVLRAMIRLGQWLKSKGVVRVRYLITPSEVDGTPVKGVDDYFAAGGSLDALEAAATTTTPNVETADDTFSDARLAETVADDVLADRHTWCKGLGWLTWDGRRWAECSEEAVCEAVRQYVLERFAAVLAGARDGRGQAGNTNAIDGWRSMLQAGRMRAVLGLARGIVERKAEHFDADPDLLNTPSGVVDLRSGKILPHDPALFLTKMTKGSYRPGYHHPDWDQAVKALPAQSRAWFQVRVGQAITGHTTPDGILVVLQGGGENGKSALTTDGVVPALGDYADVASPKLFQSNRSEHSTERADLRGQRFLIAEELTEGRALDVTSLKQVMDVGTIRARRVHKDNMTFQASHSLFLTTNYVPVVAETDHGTWRRLGLLKFPYTYRKPDEPLQNPERDRRGDPTLKGRIKEGAGGQHDAIVTWAVEGALAWYADPDHSMAMPPQVAADTREWRTGADRVLGYWDERLVADPEACVLTTDTLEDFNDWLVGNGHNAWPKELFGPRFKSHSETSRNRVVEKRTTKLSGLRRRSAMAWASQNDVPAQPTVYVGVRFRMPADQGKPELLADVADPLTNSLTRGGPRKFVEGSATSAKDLEADSQPSIDGWPSNPTQSNQESPCSGCGWPLDSAGHIANCQAAA